jgi:hypothetical protein
MSAMPFEDFETAYETLATAIDQAGPAREALFLTRRHRGLQEGHRDRARWAGIATFRDNFCLRAPIDQLSSCERQEFLMG